MLRPLATAFYIYDGDKDLLHKFSLEVGLLCIGTLRNSLSNVYESMVVLL